PDLHGMIPWTSLLTAWNAPLHCCTAHDELTLLIVQFFRRGVVDLDAGLRLQRAQRLVTTDHDFVACLQAFGNFNIGNTGDASFDRAEDCFLSVNHEYALHFI